MLFISVMHYYGNECRCFSIGSNLKKRRVMTNPVHAIMRTTKAPARPRVHLINACFVSCPDNMIPGYDTYLCALPIILRLYVASVAEQANYNLTVLNTCEYNIMT